MKLIVQIPCYNEADTLGQTVRDIPKTIEGIDSVEILVVDDGSHDDTSLIARELGVDHIIRHRTNRGLARSFATGIDACLNLGADIIVNTDGDNQYAGSDIPKLVGPILRGESDIVVGDRRTWTCEHFSRFKRILQQVGSFAVRRLSNTHIPDAVSGFRAFSRDAAMRINVVTTFSYTIETIIQAGRNRMAIGSVPVRTNAKTRPSRLFTSIPQFLRKSGGTMLRAYAMYRPFTVFFTLGMGLFAAGLIPIIRFLYFFAIGDGNGHIQSMVLGVAMLILGALSWCLGILADLIAANRQLLEITLEKVRRMELGPAEQSLDAGSMNARSESTATPSSGVVPVEFGNDFNNDFGNDFVIGPNQPNS